MGGDGINDDELIETMATTAVPVIRTTVLVIQTRLKMVQVKKMVTTPIRIL